MCRLSNNSLLLWGVGKGNMFEICQVLPGCRVGSCGWIGYIRGLALNVRCGEHVGLYPESLLVV